MVMAMIQLPKGLFFLPEPEVCIQYLTDKVTGKPLPEGFFFEFNPYDIKQLPDIFSAAEEKDLFFFTKLSRKGKIGNTNINRSVGKGSWHNDQNKHVFDPDNPSLVIGTARTFTYWETGSIYNRRFLMTEYQLPTNGVLQYNPLKDPVLCRLRCHVGKKPRSRVARSSSPLLQVQSAPLNDDPPTLSIVAFSNSATLVDFPTNTVCDNSASFSCQVEPSSSVASQSLQTLTVPQDDFDTLMANDFDSLADDIHLDSVLHFLGFEEQGNDKLLYDDPLVLSTFTSSSSSNFPTNTVSDNSASFSCQGSIPFVCVLPPVSSVASQSLQTLAAPQDDLDTLMTIDFDSLVDDINSYSVLDFLNFEDQWNDQLLLPPTSYMT